MYLWISCRTIRTCLNKNSHWGTNTDNLFSKYPENSQIARVLVNFLRFLSLGFSHYLIWYTTTICFVSILALIVDNISIGQLSLINENIISIIVRICTLLYKCFVESFRQIENEQWGKSGLLQQNKDITTPNKQLSWPSPKSKSKRP